MSYTAGAARHVAMSQGFTAPNAPPAAPGLHFDRRDQLAGAHDEIHLAIALAPDRRLVGTSTKELDPHAGVDKDHRSRRIASRSPFQRSLPWRDMTYS